uniref:CCHC-type domain-containing protein n=1 Tax=Paramormyrops kingsleyae TaxID=1676925 RepID=A0A3B3S715_9TELE
ACYLCPPISPPEDLPPTAKEGDHATRALMLNGLGFHRSPGFMSLSLTPCDRILRLAMDPARNLENRVAAVEQLLASQAAQVPLPASPSRSSAPLPIALPERYDGNPDQCKEMFTTPSSEVRFTISLLTGRAREWATALWADDSPLLRSGSEFHLALMEVFDLPAVGRRPGWRLLQCRQGNRSAAEFSLEFRTIATALRWPDDCLQVIFLRVLNPDLQDEPSARGEAPSFEELVRQAVWLDNTVRDRRRRRPQVEHKQTRAAPNVDTVEPMQVGRSPLTSAERRRQTQGGLCLNCGGTGHALTACPVRPQREERTLPVGDFSLLLSSLTQFTVSVILRWKDKSCRVRALIDSGAAGNFLDVNLARQLQIPLRRLAYPITIHGVTGERMMNGTIKHRTHPFLNRAKDPLILGLPWLRKHNPRLEWRTGEITAWSERCLHECTSLPCKATGVESPEPENLENIPEEYQDYKDIFSKEKAFSLPPYRDCDCPIDLLERAPLPRGRLYPVSLQEQDSLDTYIREGLKQGIIQASTSPVTAGFFFIKKKDGEPLPLIPSTLEQLREFLGYVIQPGEVAIDCQKITAIRDWPPPRTLKELQRFLGFANFYRSFIRNFSQKAAPLTSLTRGKPTKITWTPVEE